jgi:hypothetical protein
MANQYIGNYSGFVPQLTGQVIAFVRDSKKFKINRYVQFIPADATVGLYWKMERDEQVRDIADDSAWADGSSRKYGEGVSVSFDTASYQTIRRNEKFTLGEIQIKQAQKLGGLPLKKIHTDAATSITMTKRTGRFLTLLELDATWSTSGHVKTAAQLSGLVGDNAKWKNASDDPASPSYLAIWKAISAAWLHIQLDTNGAVTMDDLRLVINPELAQEMAQSGEINNYIRQTAEARKNLEGDLWPNLEQYGLPQKYRGVEIVVEDAMKVTTKKKAAGTEATGTDRVWLKAKTNALLVSRPGGIDGEVGPSASTVQCYHHEGLIQVEAFSDAEDRLVRGHVCEDVDEVVSAEYSGYKINGVA